MKKMMILAIAVLTFACQNEKNKQQERTMNYPETKRVDTVDNYFGTDVHDPYRWLEDDMSDETKAWVDSQNEVTFSYLEEIPFRQQLADRLTEIWNYEKVSAPFKRAGKYFFYKNDGLKNQSVLYIQDDLDSDARVLLDPNTLSEDGTVSLTSLGVSENGKYLAYGIARGGSDWNEIFVKDIASGELLKDHLKWIKFSGISWVDDGFYYSRYKAPEASELSDKNEAQKVYFHKVNTSQDKDKLVFESDEKAMRFYSASVTDDKKYLIMYESESTSGNLFYIKDLTNKNAEFIKITEGYESDYAVIDHIDGKLYMLTNDGAPRYRLVAVNPDKPQPDNWQEIIPEKDEVLAGCSVTPSGLVARYMKDAKSVMELYGFNGQLKKEIELPGIGSVSGFSANKEDNFGFYSFQSFTIPNTVYRYDFETDSSQVFFQPNIDFQFDDYVTKQVFYESKDGTQVPMFIVHHKDVQLDGSNPTLLYGYGGFNISLTPSFSLRNLLWLENKGVYAVANIRGGGEYGEEWHKAGIKLQKQNVFDDFIGAAEYLITQNYTAKRKIAIFGGSNGGLLVGAVTNQRPDLFGVAIPAVGVMDMLRYHKFTIGWAWATDYGTSDEQSQFANLHNISPVHNVSPNYDYPAILVTTGDHDDRVVPAHSFKYIANLQYHHKGANPTLIRIEKQAGHGAGKPTSKQIQEIADMWAFAFYNLGVEPVYGSK